MLAEHPITGYQLSVLYKWNIGNGNESAPEKGYELPKEEKTNNIPNILPTKNDNMVGYGGMYTQKEGDSSATDYPQNDISNPIVFVAPSQAMIISNAMTEYYNEKHNYNEGSDGYLDYVYINDDGTPIKKLSDASTRYTSTIGHLSNMGNIKAKGFRMMTNAEYEVASRIIPSNTYGEGLYTSSYMYTQLQRNDMLSGGDFTGLDRQTDSDLIDAKIDEYAYYAYNSGEYGKYENLKTHGFKIEYMNGDNTKPSTIAHMKPNNIGLYGMTGNVTTICDSVIKGFSSKARFVRGTSYKATAPYLSLGNQNYTYEVGHTSAGGIRLARTL